MKINKNKRRIMRIFIIAILLWCSPCLYAQDRPTFEQAWQAAQNGEPNGYFLLGFFYYQGEGITQNFTEAIKWFKKAANNGLSNSYGFLGACYITQKNYVEAINWFKKAINNGDCCYADLGACYLQLGKFTEAIPWLKKGIDDKRPEYYVSLGQCYYFLQNYTEAIPWLKKAADKGITDSYFTLGLSFYFLKNYTEAIIWLEKAANNGVSQAYAYLGQTYYEQQNYAEAFKWYQKAALNGETSAFAWMGIMYYWGYGTARDYSKSFMWFKKAAQLVNPLADHWLGQLYIKGLGTTQNDYEAFKCFKRATDGGEIHSLNWLGELYYEGRGTEKDYKKAFECFQNAANNGIELAYAWLGKMYYAGEGVTQNYSEAYKWTKKAVDKGIKDAYFLMGILLYQGQGTQQNYNQAFKWLKMAADNGDIKAFGPLGSIYLQGNGVEANPREAFKWTKKSVESGDISSYTGLGIMYYNGIGTERNAKEAFNSFEKTSSKGDPVASGWLGYMYLNGIGTQVNKELAFKLTKFAAEKDIPMAIYGIGYMYEFGLGTTINTKEAIKWYQKSYEKGDTQALSSLSLAHYKENNYVEAKKWAEIAITKDKDAFVGYRILALLNMYGFGVPQNKSKAFEFIAKAIDEAKQKGGPMPNTLDVEGELYLANNDISKAREIYNAILKETPDFYARTETKLSKFMKEHKGDDVDINIPIANNMSNLTFAVIISNEKYQMEKPVQYAENDGKIFTEYCKKALGLPEKNVHFITNATLNNIKHEIKWLQDVIAVYNGDAKVIFYYAGHGIPDEQNKSAYLLPIDGYGSDVTTGYALEDLYKALGCLPSKAVTVFLDACFSGAKRDGDMLASARGVAIKVKQNNPTGNMVVFTAAQGDETAYPYKEEGHGLFTYYLLKKLQETKGDVTLGELGDYIKTQVERQSIVTNGKLQSPAILSASSIGNSWKEWKLNK